MIYNQLQINVIIILRRERLAYNFIQLCLVLGGEFYQFICNLPLLLRSIITRSSFSPLNVDCTLSLEVLEIVIKNSLRSCCRVDVCYQRRP